MISIGFEGASIMTHRSRRYEASPPEIPWGWVGGEKLCGTQTLLYGEALRMGQALLNVVVSNIWGKQDLAQCPQSQLRFPSAALETITQWGSQLPGCRDYWAESSPSLWYFGSYVAWRDPGRGDKPQEWLCLHFPSSKSCWGGEGRNGIFPWGRTEIEV